MPSERPAREIEPVLPIASRRRILPGPSARSAPKSIRTVSRTLPIPAPRAQASSRLRSDYHQRRAAQNGRGGGLWCLLRQWTKLIFAHLTWLWLGVLRYAQRRTIMGLFDSLKGALESEALPAMLNTVLAQTQYHDLNGLVAALEKGGLGPQVQSWLGNGQNMPITADQLKAVLGNAQVQDFARHLGLPVDEMLKLLAQYLPEIVDKASPNGVLQPHA